MLSQSITTPTGFRPNLQLGVDYKVTRSGVAQPITAEAFELFKGIQRSVSTAANLFGLPGSITVDGAIGGVTGSAVKFTIAKFTDDLRSDVSPGARDGDPAAIAKDARNVLGVLEEAIARKSAAPVPTPTFKPLATLVLKTAAPKSPAPAPAPIPAQPIVKTAPVPTLLPTTLPPGLEPVAFKPAEKKFPTLAVVGAVGAIALLGTAVVLVRRRR